MAEISLREAFQRIPLFRTIASSTQDSLQQCARLERYQAGQHAIRMGDANTDILFIAHGRAHVTRAEANGKEVIVSRLEEGDLFGELAALTGESRSAFVVAASDCTILRVSQADFERILLRDADFLRALLKVTATRLRRATDKIADLALLDVEARLLKALGDLAEPCNEEAGYRLVVKRKPTHAELANSIGSTREVVSRTLKRLQEADCLEATETKIFLR